MTDDRLWHDFATANGGDAVDFFQRASGLSRPAACRVFVELAGGSPVRPATPARPPAQPTDGERDRLNMPALHSGKESDLLRLAELRTLDMPGLRAASKRGYLRFGVLRGQPAWVITDGERNAQARRLDGGTWHHIGGAKAWTLPGSKAGWPIGLAHAKDCQLVALVEGGPDFLAAYHFCAVEGRLADVAPVAMLGASMRFPAEALQRLAGKRVRMFPHLDAAGATATRVWAAQLESVGCDVECVGLDGLRQSDETPVCDLNDVCRIHADDFENHRFLWRTMI